ncbi:hypothetical protein DFH27DRAFT_657250 [Peziza echinospora]|nr:hypothetical protein DFH27DRAFT_657250 [Peziza echinospora]
MASFSDNPNREPLAPPPKHTKTFEGGDLADFAAHGTTVPNENPTQAIHPSERGERSHKAHAQSTGHADIIGAADNVTSQPEAPGAEWRAETGEVITGTGDSFPMEAEMKNVGGATAGGKLREKSLLKSRGQPHS